MGRKKHYSADEIFDHIYQKFYTDNIEFLFKDRKQGKQVYPPAAQQNETISNCLKTKCAFRFLYNPAVGLIEPLKAGDNKFPFSYSLDNKTFFEKYVHRGFLIPYWIYAGFAYRVAAQMQATREEILEMQYQVELPVRLPGEDDYAWYLQQSKVLSVDEHNQVISHINIYHFLRPLLTENFTETRVIEATVLKDEKLNKKFQQIFKNQLSDYFKKGVFNKQEMLVIQYHAKNKKGPATLPYKESYMQDLNKNIIEKMKMTTGYKFLNIHKVVLYLEEINAVPVKKPGK